MMDKLKRIRYFALLAVMMLFGAGITCVYAEMPTDDSLKNSENSEQDSTEKHDEKIEEDKKEELDKAQKDRGYGPLNSLDLYMNVINTVEGAVTGDRFGENLEKMLKKYGAVVASEQAMLAAKKMEKYERQKAASKQLREEKEAKDEAVKDIKNERQKKDKKRSSLLSKSYNWYKNNSQAQSTVEGIVNSVANNNYEGAVDRLVNDAGSAAIDAQVKKYENNEAAKSGNAETPTNK